MRKNNITEPSCSTWNSPCALVPKLGGIFRFLNSLQKAECSDCIDCVGKAKYVTTLDLLKSVCLLKYNLL